MPLIRKLCVKPLWRVSNWMRRLAPLESFACCTICGRFGEVISKMTKVDGRGCISVDDKTKFVCPVLFVIAIPAIDFVEVKLQKDTNGTGIGHLIYFRRKDVILIEAPQESSHLGAREIHLAVEPPFLASVFEILKRLNFHFIFSFRTEGWIGWCRRREQ